MLRACIQTPQGPKEPLINILGEEREDGDPLFFCESECESLSELAERILAPEEPGVRGRGAFDFEWQRRLESNLDNACLPVSRSSNLMLKGILEAAARKDGALALEDLQGSSLDLPPNMESAVFDGPRFRASTLGYLWEQASAAIAQPKILPDGLPSVKEREKTGDDGPFGVASRKSACEFSSISRDDVAEMLQACRARGQTLSGALSAACLMACSDVAHAEGCRGTIPYKFLMAVDLRRFGKGEQSGSADWTGGTVACAGGAIDYVVKVSVGSGVRLSGQGVEAATNAAREEFWRLAQRCKTATRDMVEKETIREAVAVFDWAMDNMSIWASLEIESRNPKTLGRAYTCGVSNMGRYPFETQVGDLSLKAIHYGTSQSACGSLFQLSCGTVDGELFMTLQFAEPIVSRSMAKEFLQGVARNLRAGCSIQRT
ncbi:unnamed protein product [Ascophyllum nodosum]